MPEIFQQDFVQSYRVADAAQDRYELYIGEEQAPDFSSPPAATSATLPFTCDVTPPPSGSTVFHGVVRKRNKYGLLSHNQWPVLFEIGADGYEVLGPITAPEGVVIQAASGLRLTVIAEYRGVDANMPDQWEIYAAVGSTPDPEVDTPVHTSSLALFGSTAGLQVQIGPFAEAAVMEILVVARRTADNAYAAAAVVEHTMPTLPSLPQAGMSLFGGAVFVVK